MMVDLFFILLLLLCAVVLVVGPRRSEDEKAGLYENTCCGLRKSSDYSVRWQRSGFEHSDRELSRAPNGKLAARASVC